MDGSTFGEEERGGRGDISGRIGAEWILIYHLIFDFHLLNKEKVVIMIPIWHGVACYIDTTDEL